MLNATARQREQTTASWPVPGHARRRPRPGPRRRFRPAPPRRPGSTSPRNASDAPSAARPSGARRRPIPLRGDHNRITAARQAAPYSDGGSRGSPVQSRRPKGDIQCTERCSSPLLVAAAPAVLARRPAHPRPVDRADERAQPSALARRPRRGLRAAGNRLEGERVRDAALPGRRRLRQVGPAHARGRSRAATPSGRRTDAGSPS